MIGSPTGQRHLMPVGPVICERAHIEYTTHCLIRMQDMERTRSDEKERRREARKGRDRGVKERGGEIKQEKKESSR